MNVSLLEGLVLALAAWVAALFVPRVAPLHFAARVSVAVFVATLAAVAWRQPELVTSAALILVTSLSAVVARYSATSLEGEPGLQRYARALLGVLGAVVLLVVANDLALIGIAWMLTSLGLHQLLTFYPDREAAQEAAHKKFVQSRIADALMLSSVALVAREVGSLRLEALKAFVATHEVLPVSLHAAALCLVGAVVLRAAQLPFHGWLTQVMEAPTPVSALLHAGVVNLGGVVLLRVSSLIDAAPLARAALVLFGLSTAVVAGLVVQSRVSVKLALAWSTCAQLGFMLVECGLGAWSLALLHLLAHSAYKAHAFLSAGSVVEQWRAQALARPTPRAAWRSAGLSFAALGALFASLGAAHAGGEWLLLAGAPVLVWLVLSWRAVGAARAKALLVLQAAGVGGAFGWWHQQTGGLNSAPLPALLALTCAGLTGLAMLQPWLELSPQGRLARAAHPALFTGLGLDEAWTRLVRPRRPSPTTKGLAAPELSTSGGAR